MKLVFLGTGSGKPSVRRNVSGIALVLPGRGAYWLFDCGDGTQRQLLLAGLQLTDASRVFITHLHGDHLFGLPGLLASLGLSGKESALPLHAPGGIEGFLRECESLTGQGFRVPQRFHRLEEGASWEADGLRVRCRLLAHGIPSYGFRVEEPAKPGRIDLERLKAAGLSPGPECGRLKAGEDVALPDGRVVRPADVVGPPTPGRVVAILGDTTACAAAADLARGADALVCEATYGEALGEKALARGHSTAAMSARVAADAGVGRLILTHFSARYESDSERTIGTLLNEARAIFPETVLAEDLLAVDIPPRRVP